MKPEIIQDIEDNSNRIDILSQNYRVTNSAKDNNSIYTVQETRRKSDNSLYRKLTLSNPNSYGQYQTGIEIEYQADGSTIESSTTWTFYYDINDTNPKSLPIDIVPS